MMHVCMYVCRNFHNLLYLNSHYFPVVGILNGRLDVEIGKNGKIFLEFINSRVKFFRVLHKIHPVLVPCVCVFFKSQTIDDECHLPLRATKLLSTWGQNNDESTVTDFEFWQFFLGCLFLTFHSAHDCWNERHLVQHTTEQQPQCTTYHVNIVANTDVYFGSLSN